VNGTTALQNSAFGKAEDLLRGTVDGLVNRCHSFLDWQRAWILQGKPDSETMHRHRESLKWLLRLVRALLAQAEDPEYPDPAAARELRAVLWKLSESWEAIYNPLPDPEYHKLADELFPGHESGT